MHQEQQKQRERQDPQGRPEPIAGSGSDAGGAAGAAERAAEPAEIPEEAADDVAERPGSTRVDHDHADELVDEWGEESFPGSDPPAHY